MKSGPIPYFKLLSSYFQNHIYGTKKEQRNSKDSGRGSLSHSADTLLMRLHPSHLRKSKKAKEKLKSESDSGVITDSHNSSGHGQVAINYVNDQADKVVYNNQSNSGFQEYNQDDYQSHSGPCVSDQSNSVNDSNNQSRKKCQTGSNTGEVNPYSCVNIVDQINSASEKLKRKASVDELTIQFSNGSSGVKQSTGSTLSLPPVCHKGPGFVSQSLDFRTKSADNKLDFEERKLSCMSETKEYESSDNYSEDGTLDSVDDIEHETSSSGDAVQPPMTSYIHFTDGDTLAPHNNCVKSALPSLTVICNCKSKLPVLTADGYLTEAAIKQTATDCMCKKGENGLKNMEECLDNKQNTLVVRDDEIIKSSLRPVSQVLNFPPHFFGSMSTVPVDPSNTTEL